MEEGDMCDRFLAAVGNPQLSSTQRSSLNTSAKFPVHMMPEDAFFEFDHYDQENAITSMRHSQQQAQDTRSVAFLGKPTQATSLVQMRTC